MGEHRNAQNRQSALLVGVSLSTRSAWEAEESLNELGRLAATATLVDTQLFIDEEFHVWNSDELSLIHI